MNIRVDIAGEGMDLYIAEISREQLHRLEKACAFFGKFYWKNALQNLWYLKQAKMQEIFGVHSFRQMQSGQHRYLGPVLRNKQALDALLERMALFVDDSPQEIDPGKIRTSFQATPPLPKLTDSNVVVFHGEYYQGITSWTLQSDAPFNLKQMRLHFADCGDNGYILQCVSYRGQKARSQEEAQTRGYLKLQFVVG